MFTQPKQFEAQHLKKNTPNIHLRRESIQNKRAMQWPYRLLSKRTSMTSEVKLDISYQLYDLNYLCSHVRLASKFSYWLNLARKCLAAAFQWWPPRLRTRPRCSVTLVASKRHWRSSVNMFLWFSGLKLPSFELVRDRGGHPSFFPSDHLVMSH